jgi:hypothetical protein
MLEIKLAVLAGLDADVEDTLQALRPTHSHVPWGCPRLFLRRAVCATELGRHDPRSQAMIRRKQLVIQCVQAWKSSGGSNLISASCNR